MEINMTKQILTIELDEFDIHTLTYTMDTANKNDEYLQRRIYNVIKDITTQIKKQTNDNRNKYCPLMKSKCIQSTCMAWTMIDNKFMSERFGCNLMEK